MTSALSEFCEISSIFTPTQLHELEIISTQYEAKAITYAECVEACRKVQEA